MALFSRKQSDITPRRRSQPSRTAERAAETSQPRNAFRRNRTLTGSASSQVVGTSESSAQLKSPRVQTHELAQKRRHIGATLLLVLIGSAALYALILQFTANVVVKAHDSTISLDPVYAQTIESYFSSQPIERLRFMLDGEHLNEYMRAKTPEVASVAVKGSAGFSKSAFTVTLREPIAGWSINGRRQYVDSTGTAFERNYFAAPAVQIVDKSGVQIQAGQAVASNRFLSFVGRATGLAKLQGYNVKEVTIPRGTTREVELRLEGVSYPIKLSVDRSAGEQAEDMARAIHWLQAKSLNPEYLDVRVSSKAFYR